MNVFKFLWDTWIVCNYQQSFLMKRQRSYFDDILEFEVDGGKESDC